MAQGPAKKNSYPVEHHDLDGLADDDHSFYPKGVLGYAEVTTSQTGITSETDATGLSVTVDVGANRRIRISYNGLHEMDTANARSESLIKEGATNKQVGLYQHAVSGSSSRATAVASVVLTPSEGSHTYKIVLAALDGGTMALVALSTVPAFILVEDIGPA